MNKKKRHFYCAECMSNLNEYGICVKCLIDENDEERIKTLPLKRKIEYLPDGLASMYKKDLIRKKFH